MSRRKSRRAGKSSLLSFSSMFKSPKAGKRRGRGRLHGLGALSTGAKVGIGVGLAALIGGGVWWFFFRKKPGASKAARDAYAASTATYTKSLYE